MKTFALALVLTAAPAFAQDAILVVADDGSVPPSEARAIRAMRSVTERETPPFAEKPGERFFFIGLPIALYDQQQEGGSPLGLSLGYGYEAESFRLGGSGSLFFRGGQGHLMLSGAWIPLAGEWSPYLGGGLGYQWVGHGPAGLGAKLEVGLEAFRLHGVRALAGFEFVFPLYDTKSDFDGTTHSVYPDGFISFGF
jgi:hypothetical protein